MDKKLYRSKHNRILLGVCGGLGDYFNVDPVIVRVIAVLLLIPGFFPAVIAYFVMAIVIPEEGSTASTPADSIRENITDIRDSTLNLGQELRTSLEKQESSAGSGTRSYRMIYLLGAVLIAAGILLLLGSIYGWLWRYFWPVFLIAAGIIIILLVRKR